jgi:DNA-binding response OmpR family regulator
MKILIIDDEPLIRRSLMRALESKGHQVFLGENGLVGYEVWLREKPDLIFLDMLMPVLAGPEFLQKLGKDKNCPVILMSAFSGQYDHKKAQEMGADQFLAKPFSDIFAVVELAERLGNIESINA